jgi:hypothetical protein
MIDRDQLRVIVLSMGMEDYYGLYELVGELNGRYPMLSQAEKVVAASEVLGQLLQAGYVAVFSSPWVPRNYVPVPPQNAARIIDDPESWRSPADVPDGFHYAFGLTPAGEAAYRTLPAEVFKGLWG